MNDADGTLTRRSFLAVSALALSQAGAQTAPNSPLKIAMIGGGGQGRWLLKTLQQLPVELFAICDLDPKAIRNVRKDPFAKKARPYDDYRKLLQVEKEFDAVVIATPDHWHAPLCEAFMRAGKHVYCEKPLTRTIAEARRLKELARNSPVITQMGNQGSATLSMRRSLELLEAGALGQIQDLHVWVSGGKWPRGQSLPQGSDPVPEGFNWDFWLGSAPQRPYKEGLYHPYQWRGWYDFGTGQLGNFGTHALNIPSRALQLENPEKIELLSSPHNDFSYPKTVSLCYHFPQRGNLQPLKLYWHDGLQTADSEIQTHVIALYKKPRDGLLIRGEKGEIFTDLWNQSALIKLHDEPGFKSVAHHPATDAIPAVYPRISGHVEEFVNACRGQGSCFSDFQRAATLTELGLVGIIALRLGRTITWDAPTGTVPGVPEAMAYIDPPVRNDYLTRS